MSIDPNLLSIVLGLITNGLTSLIAMSGKTAGNLLIGKEFQEKWELEKTSLAPILHSAIQSVAENVEWKGPNREEIVSLFLLSPEVEDIIRQIYATRFAGGKKNRNLTSLHRLFLTSFTRFIASYSNDKDLREVHLTEPVSLLFNTLVKECDLLLQSATDKGILAAHEAKSAFRHHIIHSELEAIQKKIDFLVEQAQFDLRATLDYEEKYRSQVGETHSRIIPPSVDSARKFPIDDLFVIPRFRTIPRLEKDISNVLTMDEFNSRIHRAVLLGNPGGGKSTFSLKLCYDLAMQYPGISFAGRSKLTPILVILREYGADKKDRSCSILEFIETQVKSTYQLPSPPPHTFEYLLLNGRVMIIFDGLDELLDTSYRQKITEDVEAFCRLYPSVPVLVTSREVGYEQAPLDERMFETFRLAEFNDDQIQAYVRKWFTAEERDTPTKQREDKINAFLNESKVVPDLRSNPLMLSLLCRIYRIENYIPRNRPDVYKTCADMLFEQWDRRRKIYRPPDLLEEHMRPLMEYLAQWIYQDKILRNGVTEGELVTKATEYLFEWVFEDNRKQKYKAERTAEEFVQFCTGGRAWVFLDTGTKKEGEKLYQFAHTTFLEYFTASYFVSTCPVPEALATVLLTRIERREWDVMAQLAFQIQSKRISGAADELLMLLLNARTHKDHNEINLLSFAVRCLHFMTPRPKVLRCIANAWMEHISAWKYNVSRPFTPVDISNHQRREVNYEIFKTLLSLSPNSQEIIIDNLKEFLIKWTNSETETEIFKAIEICTYIVIIHSHKSQPNQEEISTRVLEICKNRLIEFAPQNIDICSDAVLLKVVNLTKMIEWHGINSIFHSRNLQLFNVSWGSKYRSIINWLLMFAKESQWGANYLNDLKELGKAVLSLPMPCFKQIGELEEAYHLRYLLTNKVKLIKSQQFDELRHWEPNVRFGAIIILALNFENEKFMLLLDNINIQSHPIWKFVGKVLQARVEQVPSNQVQAELDKCGFSQEQQIFIWRWIRKEINLIQTKTRKVIKSD